MFSTRCLLVRSGTHYQQSGYLVEKSDRPTQTSKGDRFFQLGEGQFLL
ncbi:MAG: hypothetical protein WBA93_24420 [Microcoleaceae cyanobacterium]